MISTSPHRFLASVSKDFAPVLLAQPELLADMKTVLEEAGLSKGKWCALRPQILLWEPVALSLYRNLSIPDAFGRLVDLMRAELPELPRKPVTSEAHCHGRERLGITPVKRLFELEAARFKPAPSYRGLRVSAIDGTHLDMPDTESNVIEFGRHKVSKGRTAYPSLKAVLLVDTVSHKIRGAELGDCYFDERLGTKRLLKLLDSEDLLLMDRGISSTELFWTMKEKARVHFLGRISWFWKPKLVKVLGPGDFLVEIKARIEDPDPPQGVRSRTIAITLVVRLLEYRVDNGEIIRLVTDLEDPVKYPAEELAKLYHARWEAEIFHACCTPCHTFTNLAAVPAAWRQAVVHQSTVEVSLLAAA